jgi:hypothetical protein
MRPNFWMKRASCLAPLAVAACSSAFAATNYVSLTGAHEPPFDSWEKAATNIQLAVAAGHDGDTVMVTNGTYILTSQVVITNGITVRGANGALATFVDGGFPTYTQRCFNILHSNAVLEGFTIMNANTLGCVPDLRLGAGVHMATGGVVRHCIIRDNRTSEQGGGIYSEKGGIVEHCLIMNNSAVGGAGVVLKNGGRLCASVVTGNTSEEGSGGGVSVQARQPD